MKRKLEKVSRRDNRRSDSERAPMMEIGGEAGWFSVGGSVDQSLTAFVFVTSKVNWCFVRLARCKSICKI